MPHAMLSDRGGSWHLYVARPGPVVDWPEYTWRRPSPVPTLAERRQAVALLGFEPVPGAEWTWTEDSDIPDEPTSAVRLLAALTVRPAGEVTS